MAVSRSCSVGDNTLPSASVLLQILFEYPIFFVLRCRYNFIFDRFRYQARYFEPLFFYFCLAFADQGSSEILGCLALYLFELLFCKPFLLFDFLIPLFNKFFLIWKCLFPGFLHKRKNFIRSLLFSESKYWFSN